MSSPTSGAIRITVATSEDIRLPGRGLERIELKVDADNETSQAFWRSMGFGPHTETWAKTGKGQT